MSSLRLKSLSIAWRLTLVAMFAIPAALFAPAAPAESGGGFSRVIPIVGVVGAIRARNRIYRTANAYMAEKNALYDRYHEKAREMLAEREIRSLRDSQTGAFIKIVGVIEGERRAMEDYAEMEKRAAREQFHDSLEEIIVNRILASVTAGQVLGALTKGLQSSQGFIDSAIDEISGGGGGLMADVQRASEIAGRVSMVGGLIGGPTGAKIKAFGDRVAGLVNKPRAEIRAGLEQVQAELGDIEGWVEDLKARGVTLTPSEVGREVLITAVTGEDADPHIRSIVDMLLGRAGLDGTFRSRAREALIGNYVARCAAMGQRLREAINALRNGDPDSGEGYTSALELCTEVDLERIAQEAVEEDQNDQGGETAGEVGLHLVSLEVLDAWCFPKSPYGENYLCNYTLNWVFDYSTPAPPAKLTCTVQQVDFYNSTIPTAQTLEESGIWAHSLGVSGFYPELGEYTETIRCELREGDFQNGTLYGSYESSFVVPLLTIQEP